MPTPDWLSIFEAKALADALTRSGHSVSERTAQRWKKGETQPKPQDVRAILALLGTTKEAAPPEWAERLQATVDSVYERQDVIMERQGKVGQDMAGKVIEALAPLDRLRRVPELERRLDRLLSQLDVDPPERTDTEDQGEAARADQGLS
jgi:hypothetical protein